jgi:hypothetical protein
MDEVTTEIDCTELVRLEPGEIMRKTYDFIVEDDTNSLFNNDVHNLVAGNTYELKIRHQKWLWMYEADMPQNCSLDNRKDILFRLTATEWQPESRVTFQVSD